MPLSYEKNKKHIYNWIEKNRDRHNELSRKSSIQSYYKKRYLLTYYDIDFNFKLLRKIGEDYFL